MTDSERVWNERELTRRANRRLVVLRHAEEVTGRASFLCSASFSVPANSRSRARKHWSHTAL